MSPPHQDTSGRCAWRARTAEIRHISTSRLRLRRALRSAPARRNAATAACSGKGVWKSAVCLTRAISSMTGPGAAIQPIRKPGTRSLDRVPSQTTRSGREAASGGTPDSGSS